MDFGEAEMFHHHYLILTTSLTPVQLMNNFLQRPVTGFVRR